MTNNNWTKEFETELTLFLKDWLKQRGKTQADLRRSLKAVSTRMSAIIDILEKEHQSNGLPGLVRLLCNVEKDWLSENTPTINKPNTDQFGQLDLLLKEIRQDLIE